MPVITIKHEINCDADRFWQLFFDDEFNAKLYKTALGFPKYDVVEHKETDTQIARKVSATPKVDMPGPIAKLLGSNFTYVEEGKFDKTTKRWTWKMIPGTLGDKLRNEGALRIEALGAGKVQRIADLTIEAKVFGLGGMIESTAEKQFREGWDRSAKFMNDYLRDAK